MRKIGSSRLCLEYTMRKSSASASASHNNNCVRCANCGRMGHVYKVCKYPISSFGVICVRRHEGRLQYLMVQRKFSLCFVEFIRGNYSLHNRNYIMQLLENMTSDERANLLTGPFERIWAQFWSTDSSGGGCFIREFNKAQQLYNKLRQGYWLRSPMHHAPHPDHIEFFCLAIGLLQTHSIYDETEWGFPKGRRNINESDIECAQREFHEETTVPLSDIILMNTNVKPVEEVFIGINHVRYRHVYYVAHVKDNTPILLPRSTAKLCSNNRICRQCTRDDIDIPSKYNNYKDIIHGWRASEHEVQQVCWFDFDSVVSKIRPTNISRLNMFVTLHRRLRYFM